MATRFPFHSIPKRCFVAIDKLRALTVGAAKNFRSEIVEYEGEQFLIREPTVGEKEDIQRKCGLLSIKTDKRGGGQMELPLAKLKVYAMIACVCDPVTEEPIFTAADFDALYGQPDSGFMSVLGNVAVEMVNGSPDEGND